MRQENLMGTSLLGWYDCENESPESCEDSMSLFETFVKHGGEWRLAMYASTMSGPDTCKLWGTDAVLEGTETGIKWVQVSINGEVEVASEEECDSDLAEERTDDLTCESMEQFEAERLD